ncbi:Oidioi.mRNA.OKI2018_I69.XSR.g16573.t1.cds [Oikopleura dioica]|uniref:Oidioi.mRNA.OKI2018_I69.XSR.g16573.t1.cds n=1 Tax=Oikopleura dioica TaxID=34765 RepID=A0ABN7SLD6_OIKDI|nr:Oidioi.mRNA.OKI2018_I69.XSR.g16573.t1.cds [Oikopleura dioica]
MKILQFALALFNCSYGQRESHRLQRFFSPVIAPRKRQALGLHDEKHGRVYTGKISAHDKHDKILQLSDIM